MVKKNENNKDTLGALMIIASRASDVGPQGHKTKGPVLPKASKGRDVLIIIASIISRAFYKTKRIPTSLVDFLFLNFLALSFERGPSCL